jgi:predicted RNA-binding Zn ribbon-like protein
VQKRTIEGFQFIAGNLALDFVNTVANRRGQSREYLDNAAAFSRWAQHAGLLRKYQTLRLNAKQLSEVRAAREMLHRIFQPLALGKAPSASPIAELNSWLARVTPKHRLQWVKCHAIWIWNTSLHDPNRVLGPVRLNASELLVDGLGSKVRQCGDEFCGWIFLDRSQAGRRRWCSMADCGNRAKARWHYRRKKKGGAKSMR